MKYTLTGCACTPYVYMPLEAEAAAEFTTTHYQNFQEIFKAPQQVGSIPTHPIKIVSGGSGNLTGDASPC